MPSLFDPVRLGALSLRNRIVMAPLTRCKADPGRVPNDLMKDYYLQRASAGLIITEATAVTPMGVGYPDTPGIWSEAQVAGWRKITDAVHAKGGLMALQLWHVGRISDPSLLDGALPVAPSAIAPAGHVSQMRPEKPFVTPRALALEEIPGIVEQFKTGALNAKAAGFDAVHIHGANGYLLDQFLHDGSNHRTDAYGGPIENRARLLLEVVDACIEVWGADRVGLHLNLMSSAHSMTDSNPEALFTYVAVEVGRRKLAFVLGRDDLAKHGLADKARAAFGGPFVANEGLTLESAQESLAEGRAVAFAFGRPYIANPDLVERFAERAPLNALNGATIYGRGAVGYTDYPSLRA